jgi:YVTN family beta-propeller protein
VQQVPPGPDTDKGILAAVFMGLAISPDNRTLYAAGGQENKIYRFDLATGRPLGEINCAGRDADRDYTDGYIGDMVLSRDGKTLYAVDQIGFRMVIVDTEAGRVTASVPVGRYPFGITLSPDEREAYVANVGMYQYKLLPSVDTANLARTSLSYPTSAFGSPEALRGYRSDSAVVPALGDPNGAESFSVWTVDLRNRPAPRVTAKVKTGFLVGQRVEDIPAVGGSSPNSVVAAGPYVFVSNGNNDCISSPTPPTSTPLKTCSAAAARTTREGRNKRSGFSGLKDLPPRHGGHGVSGRKFYAKARRKGTKTTACAENTANGAVPVPLPSC